MTALERTRMRPFGYVTRAGLAVLLTWACRTEDTGGGLVSGERLDMENIAALTVKESVRVDGMAADLVPIHFSTSLQTGGIAVSQMQDRTVLFFSPSGELVYRFGQQGRGPGEFVRVNEMGLIGDSVWISDLTLRRLTVVDHAGQLVRTVSFPADAEVSRSEKFSWIAPQGLYSDDTFLAAAQDDGVAVLRVRLEEAPARAQIIARVYHGNESRSIRTPNGVVDGDPFRTVPLHAISDDGALVAVVRNHVEGDHIGTFEIVVLGSAADTVWTRAFVVDPIRVGAGDVRRVRQMAERSITNPELAAAFQDHVFIPSVHPPVVRAVLGRDTTLALQLRQVEPDSAWVVLTPRGDVRGFFMLPSNTVPRSVSRRAVWALQRDEFDVQSIVQYILLSQ